MTIDGGMGLLISMGDNPDFVLTVGGFHPSFKPPALPFPVPPRLSIDILNAPGRLLRVSGYFAVTSNTVQFGAKAELRLGFSDFGIEGHLAFDALFQFSPFRFVIAISAGLSLKAFGVGLFGIDLQFQLEGPAPWRAHGRGSISLLFFEISADFDISWGEERNTTLPAVEVLALLEREIRKPEGWRTRPPAGGGDPLVTLRQLPEGDLVLHPLGTLFIHQRAIPLDVRIDRIGAQRPSDGKRFSVAPVAGSGLERVSVTGDQFAMAQFQDMDDAAKLSRAAYENQDAGIELAPEQGAIASPRVVRRSARYELHIIDNDPPNPGAVARPAMALARPLAASRIGAPAGPSSPATGARSLANGAGTPRPPRLYSPHPAVFGRLLAGSSTARSPLSQRVARLRQPFTQDATVQVAGDRFIVAYLRNNRQAFPPVTASSATSSFRSEATALDALDDWVHADASLSGRLHVLRQAETGGGAAVRPGTWSVTSPPPAAVAGADAVLLTGGTVLVAGGSDADGDPVAGTAVYDPVAATWADASPPLATARRRHTATKLGNGRVVVAGGLGTVGAPLASAEVFDPVAVTWTTPQGELHTARSGHSATAVGGGLLVAGGTGARGAALASAELLDPDTLNWTEVAPLNCARTGHRAVLIDHGKVLVIGGALPTGEGERALAFCEIYDPATKTWTPTGSLLTPRKGHQATVLADGRVLVTGGDAVPAVPYRPESLATAELYDPRTGTWTRAADLPGGGRTGHRSVRTLAGVLVAGGVGRPRATAGFRKVLMFDPGANAWTSTDSLGTGRWDFSAVDLSDGRVLAVGGLTLADPAAPGPAPAELAATAEVYLP
jgi:N-acetylneuraminic acid mutarotase